MGRFKSKTGVHVAWEGAKLRSIRKADYCLEEFHAVDDVTNASKIGRAGRVGSPQCFAAISAMIDAAGLRA
eukprot:7096201-Pyramimonas_sp.AAC.1